MSQDAEWKIHVRAYEEGVTKRGVYIFIDPSGKYRFSGGYDLYDLPLMMKRQLKKFSIGEYGLINELPSSIVLSRLISFREKVEEGRKLTDSEMKELEESLK